jgi:short-subunit dehydrogenase
MSRTAVISGVGSGLGASLVRKFAASGYQVALLARSPSYIEELANELRQQGADCATPPHRYN